MTSSIQLYRSAISGHCHRVELFLSLLGLPFESIDVDLALKEHKLPDFLAMNPLGQVPVLRDGDLTLADSNAILVYLEGRHAPGQWLPRDPVGAARVQRWLSLAAGPLAFGPAAARVVQLFQRPTDPKESIERAQGLFQFMESELSQTPFLVGERATLADVAHYAYVARAPEGLVSLQPYPAIRAWLARIEALPGFVPMLKSPVGLEA
ncbi:glutathione S-transferase [Hydrogenophaga sp. Root209]|uniref:glutathione S-transferase family protein n=1 Tax=Hydrogenophaga sp. Root209 TaxID=1736490 RepID=UPI0006F313BE|nr:glutathione S-transferase [Hydrogenophaga sp. Root209]KRC04385.1 glutathione S-transferase [Hydrogenophaga sp. Root209]